MILGRGASRGQLCNEGGMTLGHTWEGSHTWRGQSCKDNVVHGPFIVNFTFPPDNSTFVTYRLWQDEKSPPLPSGVTKKRHKELLSLLSVPPPKAVLVTFVVSDWKRLLTLMEGGNKGR